MAQASILEMQRCHKYLNDWKSNSFKYFLTVNSLMDSLAYTDLLQCYTDSRSLTLGKSVHAHIIRSHFKQSLFLQNNLLNMYCKCGNMKHAHKVFDEIPDRDVVSWNVLVMGYFQMGFCRNAFRVFMDARNAQIALDRFTYAGAFSICSRTGDLRVGKALHGLVVVGGFSNHSFLTNSLIDMYSKCGRIDEVRRVFENSDHLDDVSWNTLVSAHARVGLDHETARIFARMHTVGRKINCYSLGSVLKCCGCSFELLEFGRMVHSAVVKVGLDHDVFVGSTMLDMYAKNGKMIEAINVFKAIPDPNVVVFNAMIAGFCRLEDESHDNLIGEALVFYSKMQRRGIMPSMFTLSSILRACNLTDSFVMGKQIHAQVYKCSLQYDEFIGSALIDLYCNSGSIEDGLRCFHHMPKQDIVTWTSMISGSVQNEHFERALSLFYDLLSLGRNPDQFTLSSVMSACANLAMSRSGQLIQSYATKSGFNSFKIYCNSQIFMYARAGDTEAASKTFYEMDNPDVVSWSTMISNHAQHGSAEDALSLFRDMERRRISPNHVTFLSVLTACSHGGLVDEGFRYFDNMKRKYGIIPNVKHCACIVDLLGRAGKLDDAKKFIVDFGFQDDPVIWRSLLSSCRIHGDIERGEHVAERIMALEPEASATYVILYNMYLDSGIRPMAIKVRQLMKDQGVKKEPGLSWIEIGGSFHSFVAGDNTHPRNKVIYEKLAEMVSKIERLGYARSGTSKLDDVSSKIKSNLLNCHSEKLAVVLGIISLPPAAPIRVMKNLRICVDCHTTMKFFSAVEGREIVLRDPIRFHRFRGGSCSCGDYW
ncbi:Pentatricopeptide repeat-containing protein [Apostasia shenzhenica]|uniref:Pentatricopeptide repeat-containing protein n=1 Tax=Apostasia shenzhenica TaxID=1088818 RepID=A0A2I0ANR9_9ASPA|nr:Pentatricopeptide repeat-containing protein [Apostasia shenzhenica]